jgi:hypothetical protein
VISRIFLIIGAVLLLLSLLMFWGRTTLFDADGFTDRATEAIENNAVRDLLADRLADQIIEHGATQLLTVRPLVQAVVSQAMLTRPFQAIYRNAVREAHRALMESDDALVLKAVDFMIVLSAPLESLDPKLATRLPEIRTNLIELRNREFASALIALANKVRFLGWLMPLLSFVAFALAVLKSSDRNRTLSRVGFGLVAVGATVLTALAVGRLVVTNSVIDPIESEAVAELWRVFVSDLRLWSAFLIVVGLALSAAVNSIAGHVDVRSYFDQMWVIVARTPDSRLGRLTRAISILVAAGAVVAWPGFILKGLTVLFALCALYYGLIELILALGMGALPASEEAKGRSGFMATFGARVIAFAVVVLIVVGVGVLLASLLLRKSPTRLVAIDKEIEACNGSPDLCDRAFNMVAFPTTHNSMSAASESGWYFASHERGIRDQLDYGVRGFLIDVYFGIPVEGGVRTDIFHEDDRQVLAESYGDEFVAARDRVAERMGLSDPDVERQVYTCHGFCELGATSFSDALKIYRDFLDAHPHEVIVIFIEDHIPADDVAKVFEEVGLADYAFTQMIGEPWPTLREMIEQNKRLLVMAENDGSGPAWYHPGFVLTQETPYRFHSPEDFRCDPNRGSPESPLFLMNHWIEKLTPSVADAEVVNKYDVLLKRALLCEEKRGMIPNLVAVNFYSRGDLLRVVDALNGVMPTDPQSKN